MATSSIYHSVTIRDKNLCKALITALENSKSTTNKTVIMSKKVQEIRGEDILKLFGDNK